MRACACELCGYLLCVSYPIHGEHTLTHTAAACACSICGCRIWPERNKRDGDGDRDDGDNDNSEYNIHIDAYASHRLPSGGVRRAHRVRTVPSTHGIEHRGVRVRAVCVADVRGQMGAHRIARVSFVPGASVRMRECI